MIIVSFYCNIVVEVITGRNEDEVVGEVSDWEAHYSELKGLRCVRTSYNTRGNQHNFGGEPFRYNYAGIGFSFDPDKGTDGAFVPPKPEGFDSWILNDETCLWEAPVPMPSEGRWVWDEQAGAWVEVTDG